MSHSSPYAFRGSRWNHSRPSQEWIDPPLCYRNPSLSVTSSLSSSTLFCLNRRWSIPRFLRAGLTTQRTDPRGILDLAHDPRNFSRVGGQGIVGEEFLEQRLAPVIRVLGEP